MNECERCARLKEALMNERLAANWLFARAPSDLQLEFIEMFCTSLQIQAFDNAGDLES